MTTKPGTPVTTSEHAAPAHGIRQQLSCDSKEILERAARAHLSRLHRLRDEVVSLQAGAAVLDKIDAEIGRVERAIRQLAYVYIDQFEAGRAENDQAGRFGLVKGAEVPASDIPPEHKR